ncbi:heterogeneous nuclear ribonucleoprotein A2 homolog 1-like isoform X5 [Ruditapes philippinarum]|uniref:heterogeneous nuclear ribonucleoprotein A2 homolog 1-like isoform X5 n=1 Tax=Ruditapes philippinarum TaxID=129788 RepID=UPI00295ACC53|nr:heterogeneous nuclear ribonucleoprotein A2 homolog 1-like isoform X5 [Ruditapes philippinarum]
MGDYGGGYQQRSFGGGRGGGRGGGGGFGGGGRGRGGGGRGGGGGGGGNRGSRDADYYTDPNAENFCKLFLGGLAPETTEDSIKDHFGSYGTIVDCVVMRDQEKKRSRGFGFVTFSESSCVTDVQANRPHKIDGKQIETKRATPKHQQAEGQDAKVSTKKLFVGGIKDDMTEDMLREEFSKYGNVQSVKVIQGKGFCFIEFDDHDAVDWCNLIGKFQICDKWVNAKKAQDKSKQPQQGGQRGGGGNDYGGGFGQDYQGSYGGGPMKSSGGYGAQRSQPYGGGGGYGQGGYGGGQGGYGGGGGYDQSGGYGSGGGGYGSGYGSGGGGGGYGGGSGGGGGGYGRR